MSNTATDKDYEELARLSGVTGIPVPILRLEYKVTDKEGNTLFEKSDYSRSYLRNWYLLSMLMWGGPEGHNTGYYGDNGVHAYSPTCVPWSLTGGGYIQNSGVYVNWSHMRPASLNAAAITSGIDYRGIIVGSSSESESFDNMNLGRHLRNGTGTNQLSYSGQVTPVIAWTAGTRTATSTQVRYFNNNSAASITVGECGILSDTNIYSYIVVLLVRDVLSPAVVVPVGGQLTVTYILSLTYPTTAMNTTTYSYNPNVRFLVGNNNAASGTTTFADQSSYTRTLTGYGNVAYTNSTAPTGMTTSIAFDGTGDYIRIPDSSTAEMGMKDWRLDIYYRSANTSAGTYCLLSKCSSNTDFGSFKLYRSASNIYLAASNNGTSWNVFDTTFTLRSSISTNTWYKLTLIKQQGQLSVFNDGTYQSQYPFGCGQIVTGNTLYYQNGYALPDSSTDWTIGANQDGTEAWNGQMACIRLSIGSPHMDDYTIMSYSPSSLPAITLPFPIS